MYIIKIGRFPKKKRIKINSNKTRHSRNQIKKDNNFIAKSISAKNVSPLLGMTLVLFITVIALILSNALLDLLTTGSGIYIYKMMIEDTMPIAYASSEKGQIKLSGLANILLGFNLNDPKSILSSQVYAFNIPSKETVESTHIKKQGNEDSQNAPDENTQLGRILETTIQPASGLGYVEVGGIYIKNSTTYEINPSELISQPLNFNNNIKGPKVLITHSHSSESYKPTDTNYYKPTDPNRTQDKRYNVIRIGKEMAKVLHEADIEIIHDTKLHDYPSYNGAYKNSLLTIEEYLRKYPSIQIVLDVHRDAMARGNNTLLKPVTEINGEKVAQVMIVCGSDQGGLHHPNWQSNLAFAMKLQQSMNELYPTLSRPIDFRKERFNMHTTDKSLLLEVGSNANTLEEAILAGRAVANALARLLISNTN